MKSYLGADWKAVEAGIRAYLSTDISLLNDTNDSLLGSGGKQLRPIIALLVARAITSGSQQDGKGTADGTNSGTGTVNGDTIKYAVASELLHNATLLHDDVADEADQRRGQPTLRKLMGPCASVLVGDFWLVRAVRAILDAKTGHDEAIASFAQTLSDLAEGEMLQLEKARSCDTSFDDYLAIIYRKTASLFVAACKNAALSVGASPEQEQAVADYGKYIGYAFQMRDDIFDYMPSARVGKPVGVDVLEQKITLPLLGALKNVSSEEEQKIRNSIKNIDRRGRDGIVDFVRANGGIAFAQQVLNEFVDKAKRSLDCLVPSRDKEILCELAGYIAVRSS